MEAGKGFGSVPAVVAGSGVENTNLKVGEPAQTAVMCRILALVEVAFSNSVIEVG